MQRRPSQPPLHQAKGCHVGLNPRDSSFLGSGPGLSPQMRPGGAPRCPAGRCSPERRGSQGTCGKQGMGRPLLGSHVSQPGAGLPWGSGTWLMTSYQPWCRSATFPNAARPCWGAFGEPTGPRRELCPGWGSPISGCPPPPPWPALTSPLRSQWSQCPWASQGRCCGPGPCSGHSPRVYLRSACDLGLGPSVSGFRGTLRPPGPAAPSLDS